MTTIFKSIVKFCFRTLKRELENSAKNCRVLQFKLKKTEKSLNDTQSDLGEAESKLKSLSGGSNALDSINKVGRSTVAHHLHRIISFPVLIHIPYE